MAGAGLGSAAAVGAVAGGVSTGLAWTAADCCIGAGAGAGFAVSGLSSAGLCGAAFGTGTDCGIRLAILGTAACGRGGPPSRVPSNRVMGSSGAYEGRGAPPR